MTETELVENTSEEDMSHTDFLENRIQELETELGIVNQEKKLLVTALNRVLGSNQEVVEYVGLKIQALRGTE